MTTEQTEQALLQRYGPPGARPGDQGRVTSRMNAYGATDSLEESIKAISELIGVGTIDALARAFEIACGIPDQMILPPGTWCMVGVYKPSQNPDGWSVWSAHYTEEQARSWAAAYDDRFREVAERNHWGETHRFRAEQRDDAPVHALRRADVDPVGLVRRTPPRK